MSVLRKPRFWVGIAISALCLWLALREVPFVDLGRSLAGARYLWLLPAVAIQLATVVVRARRWVVLLGREDRLADGFWAQSIGYLFTNVLPFRLGEPARVLVMARRCNLPVVQVAASALVERVLDVASILLLLVLVLPWMRVPALVAQAGLVFGGLVLVSLVLLVALARLNRHGEALLRALCERVPVVPAETAIARWRELGSGFLPLARPRSGSAALGWSAASWALSVAMYWCTIQAFQPAGALVEAAFMVVALGLAVTTPSSPGFIGVFQLVGQQALALPFGAKYDGAMALAVALTAHLVYYLPTTGLGIAGLWRLGESFAGLERTASRGQRTEARPDLTPSGPPSSPRA